LCHFAVQSNHLHVICEADDSQMLARGIQGLEVRVAKRLNRQLQRKGRVFADRYHARQLKSPRQVRNALRYVLQNYRNHQARAGQRMSTYWFDPCSSAAFFDGFKEPLPWREPWMREVKRQGPVTAEATTWLLTKGWAKGGGLLSLSE
jgi:hypothetical protein